ncbi:cullin-3A-like, partial [Trifolium medium]|nr:cullin-3A-like [Trifolium medium]
APSGLTVVKDVMTSFIQDAGKQLIMDPESLKDPEAFAQHLLDLKNKYDNVITVAFNSDKIFQNVLNSAFECFINFNAKYVVHLRNSGLADMFKGDKYEDLKRLYDLFRSVPYGLVIVKDAMTSFIRDTGKDLIMDPERLKDPEAFVQRLFYLKDKYDKVIETAFNSDKIFQNVLNSAFEHFINFNAESVVHMENSGVAIMLMDDKYEDLEKMFSRVPYGLTIVKDVMTSVIRDTGRQLIMDPERLKDPVDLVQRLLDLNDKYDKVITEVFNNDKKFQIAFKSAFEYIINL